VCSARLPADGATGITKEKIAYCAGGFGFFGAALVLAVAAEAEDGV
jgi:hypothetical protein